MLTAMPACMRSPSTHALIIYTVRTSKIYILESSWSLLQEEHLNVELLLCSASYILLANCSSASIVLLLGASVFCFLLCWWKASSSSCWRRNASSKSASPSSTYMWRAHMRNVCPPTVPLLFTNLLSFCIIIINTIANINMLNKSNNREQAGAQRTDLLIHCNAFLCERLIKSSQQPTKLKNKL